MYDICMMIDLYLATASRRHNKQQSVRQQLNLRHCSTDGQAVMYINAKYCKLFTLAIALVASSVSAESHVAKKSLPPTGGSLKRGGSDSSRYAVLPFSSSSSSSSDSSSSSSESSSCSTESSSSSTESSSSLTESSSSTSSSSSTPSTSTSSSSSSTTEPVCEDEILCSVNVTDNLNFRDRIPTFGDDGTWTYFSIGDYVTNDGVLTFGPNGGFLNSKVYTRTIAPGPIFFLNDPKYLVFNKAPLSIPTGGHVHVEMCAGGQIFGLDKSPFPGDSIAHDDIRQGWVGLCTSDFVVTGISNFIMLSNDRIYALSERMPLGGDYASFGTGIPLKKRKPSDIHNLAIVYDESLREVRFIVDGEVLLTVNRLGLYPETNDYLVYDDGGNPNEAFPSSIFYGFGVGDMLYMYPWCKKPIKEGGKCHAYDWEECDYPRVPTGLVKTGLSPMFDPIYGQPYNATFVDYESLASNRIYGQGATANLQRYIAYSKKCA